LEVALNISLRLPTLLLLATGSLWCQSSINTIPSWNGTNSIESFGVTNTATYGQTITITGSTQVLQSFSFEIGNCNAAVAFRGEVYAWNGTQATGSSLFESPVTSLSAGSGFQQVTFTTGGVSLAPGTYVLFASTSKDQAGAPASACQWGEVANTTYPGGTFVFINNGPNSSEWTTATWTTNWGGDTAFSATFGISVPAASTTSLWLGVAGLIALGLLASSRLHAPPRGASS
jgi:hypothetical protein